MGCRWFLTVLGGTSERTKSQGRVSVQRKWSVRSEVDKHLLNPVIHFWLLRKNQEEIKE